MNAIDRLNAIIAAEAEATTEVELLVCRLFRADAEKEAQKFQQFKDRWVR